LPPYYHIASYCLHIAFCLHETGVSSSKWLVVVFRLVKITPAQDYIFESPASINVACNAGFVYKLIELVVLVFEKKNNFPNN